MELRTLNYFLAVAEEKNISRAAEKLHISQPSISKYIKSLEEEIGEQLFIRNTKRLILTPRGAVFRKRAQELINVAENLEAEFINSSDPMSADIYVGVGHLIAIRLIAKATARIYQKYPRIRYHFYNGSAQNISERITEGLLDFSVSGPPDKKLHDYIVLPMKATWGLIMRQNCSLDSKEYIEPADILDPKVRIAYSGQEYVINKMTPWLQTDFKNLNVVATFDLTYASLLTVAEGLGCAICADKDIKSITENNLSFHPFKPELSSYYCIVYKKGKKLSKPVQLLIDTLFEIIAEEYPEDAFDK